MTPSRPAARLVMAADYDADLAFLRPAARVAAGVIARLGTPPQVFLVGDDATQPELRVQTGVLGRTYDLAFLCCHGEAARLFNFVSVTRVQLGRVALLEPADRDLRQTEKAYLDAERRRVIYVAATRARDLLVLPRTGAPGPDKLVCSDLLAAAAPTWLYELDPFVAGAEPAWARAAGAATSPDPADASALSRAVLAQWDELKLREKGAAAAGSSALHNLPVSLPTLIRAQKAQAQAARVGFDWPGDGLTQLLDKLREETAELKAAMEAGVSRAIEDEVGDLFFTLVNLARAMRQSSVND